MKQLTFTSFEDRDKGKGGWQIKDFLGLNETELAEEEQHFRNIPRLVSSKKAPILVDDEVKSGFDTRLQLTATKAQELRLSQEVPAGKDESGRDGNTFTHEVIADARTFIAQATSPLQAFRNDSWLIPYGVEEVAAATLDPEFKLMSNFSYNEVYDFTEAQLQILFPDGKLSPGILQLLNALQDSIFSRYKKKSIRKLIVIRYSEQAEVIQYLGIIFNLLLPADRWNLHFSTYEYQLWHENVVNLLKADFDLVFVPAESNQNLSGNLYVYDTKLGTFTNHIEIKNNLLVSFGAELEKLHQSTASVSATIDLLRRLDNSQFAASYNPSGDIAWGIALLRLYQAQTVEISDEERRRLSVFLALAKPESLEPNAGYEAVKIAYVAEDILNQELIGQRISFDKCLEYVSPNSDILQIPSHSVLEQFLTSVNGVSEQQYQNLMRLPIALFEKFDYGSCQISEIADVNQFNHYIKSALLLQRLSASQKDSAKNYLDKLIELIAQFILQARVILPEIPAEIIEILSERILQLLRERQDKISILPTELIYEFARKSRIYADYLELKSLTQLWSQGQEVNNTQLIDLLKLNIIDENRYILLDENIILQAFEKLPSLELAKILDAAIKNNMSQKHIDLLRDKLRNKLLKSPIAENNWIFEENLQSIKNVLLNDCRSLEKLLTEDFSEYHPLTEKNAIEYLASFEEVNNFISNNQTFVVDYSPDILGNVLAALIFMNYGLKVSQYPLNVNELAQKSRSIVAILSNNPVFAQSFTHTKQSSELGEILAKANAILPVDVLARCAIVNFLTTEINNFQSYLSKQQGIYGFYLANDSYFCKLLMRYQEESSSFSKAWGNLRGSAYKKKASQLYQEYLQISGCEDVKTKRALLEEYFKSLGK